jgi:beta-glucuronidase
MKKIAYALFFLTFITGNTYSQENLLNSIYTRTSKSLNGTWRYIVDPYENGFYNYRYEPYDSSEHPGTGAYFTNAKPKDKSELIEYNFDRSDTIAVPGDWNTQKEKLFYYEGTIWYKRSFDYKKRNDANRVVICFGAVNYRADVYLNGKKLGMHVGGFTPFTFDATPFLRENNNFLIVKVDNKRLKEGIPTLNTDWWNYGGITRDVQLVEVPRVFISDYFIQLDPKNRTHIKGFVKLQGGDINGTSIHLSIPGLRIEQEMVTGNDGTASFDIVRKNITSWSPEHPYRYQASISAGADTVTDLIGFRTISTGGSAILLNDKKIFLRGISIHEESPFTKGRAHTREDALQLLSRAKELGCNYVRLAHYPHNEHMARLADSMGILVWEEIPVYWTISWGNEGTYRNAENQLTAMTNRDKNRASVIIWSMANETPASPARNKFLSNLAAAARKLDPTRLISAALELTGYSGNPSIKTISDPFADSVDVLSFNQYIGWYDGTPEKCKTIDWKITQNKPVIISEFGADAKYGMHGDSLTRWTEEYQEYLYRETLTMLGRIPQLQGMSPWILVDFRSPRRTLPGIQDGWNRKGLISDTGEKKKAFFVLQKFYNDKALSEKK